MLSFGHEGYQLWNLCELSISRKTILAIIIRTPSLRTIHSLSIMPVRTLEPSLLFLNIGMHLLQNQTLDSCVLTYTRLTKTTFWFWQHRPKENHQSRQLNSELILPWKLLIYWCSYLGAPACCPHRRFGKILLKAWNVLRRAEPRRMPALQSTNRCWLIKEVTSHGLRLLQMTSLPLMPTGNRHANSGTDVDRE